MIGYKAELLPDVCDVFQDARNANVLRENQKHIADACRLNVTEASRRYSPAQVVAVQRVAVEGEPEHISTSYVERSNLTLRMQSKRFARLSNGFSKKIDCHLAAVGLYVAFYNLCRTHEALKATPAMALGIADHVWSMEELIALLDANVVSRAA